MPAGAKPGERRGGRKAGTPNKQTKDSRARFRKMALEVEHVLPDIALHGSTDQARIAAVKEINERAYGKAPQPLTDVDGEGPPIIKLIRYDGD
jgi:hypothetical protein